MVTRYLLLLQVKEAVEQVQKCHLVYLVAVNKYRKMTQLLGRCSIKGKLGHVKLNFSKLL